MVSKRIPPKTIKNRRLEKDFMGGRRLLVLLWILLNNNSTKNSDRGFLTVSLISFDVTEEVYTNKVIIPEEKVIITIKLTHLVIKYLKNNSAEITEIKSTVTDKFTGLLNFLTNVIKDTITRDTVSFHTFDLQNHSKCEFKSSSIPLKSDQNYFTLEIVRSIVDLIGKSFIFRTEWK